jgi:hypothetical protein
MTVTITYKRTDTRDDTKNLKAASRRSVNGRLEETYLCSRVTFPPELPYMILGAWPKSAGKSQSIFLPDIFEVSITQ